MRTPRVDVACDLCGYGGPYARPEDFTARPGDVDLCRWCMGGFDPPRGDSWAIESGGHLVTAAGGAWTCSCGVTSLRMKLAVALSLRNRGALHVLDAVPNLLHATASIHVNG